MVAILISIGSGQSRRNEIVLEREHVTFLTRIHEYIFVTGVNSLSPNDKNNTLDGCGGYETERWFLLVLPYSV